MATKQSGLSLVGNEDEGKMYQNLNNKAGVKLGGFDQHPEHIVLRRLSSHNVNPRPLIGWRTSKVASH